MKLYLSSFKLGSNTNYLKNWIKENNNKILLIPNARDVRDKTPEEKEFINYDIESLESLGFNVTILDLRDFFYKPEELKKFIEDNNYFAFYAIGGNAFSLRIAMKLSGFDKFLLENKNNNYLYAGYSAGICVLSKTLKGYEIVEKPKNPYNDEEIITEGLGIIDYSIAPHYKSNHKSSKLVDDVINYFNSNGIKYKPIKDGEVIIDTTYKKDYFKTDDEQIR